MSIYNEDNSEILRKGFLSILKVKNPDDNTKPYEVIETGDAVVVLVLTHDYKEMYVTKQWRPCNNEQEVGLVAGKIDKNLYIIEIALAELEEEIRISREDVHNIVYTGYGYSSTGCLTEKVHRYIIVLKEGAVEDDSLPKAHDTDLIQRYKLPFNQGTFDLMKSNTSQILIKEAKEYIEEQSKRIGVMGGCYSPFTSQHTRNMLQCIEMFKLDKLIIVPCSDKYLKKKLPYAEREKLIEFALAELSPTMRSKIVISDLERSKISQTTYQTMVELQAQYSNDKLYCILGTDNIESLGKGWDMGEELLSSFPIIGIERVGYEMNKIYTNPECQLLTPYVSTIHQIPPTTENIISSSLVRRKLMQGLDITTLVSREARDYLELDETKALIKKCYNY